MSAAQIGDAALMTKQLITLTVNGRRYEVVRVLVDPMLQTAAERSREV